ncbi:MAG: hypothetical protein ABL967_15200 [Bryobacteraceae bacterium]
MASRYQKKTRPPAPGNNPLQQKDPKAALWVIAVMVVVLLSVVAMFGLAMYLLNDPARPSTQAPRQAAPVLTGEASK